MNYQKIRNNLKQFQSITSLSVEEFDGLLAPFELSWNNYIRKYTLSGKVRTRKYVAKSKDGLLTIEEKLFFILSYQKNNTLQEYHSASFGLTQDMGNKWIHILSPLLDKSLVKYAAAKDTKSLNSVIIENNTYIGDCTERLIERPTVDQEEVYSGKKKAHTIKNLILCCLCGFVIYVGKTTNGKVHDKKMAATELSFGKKVNLLLDLGFQGFNTANAQVFLPHKKPRKKELTKIQKKENQVFSRERVLIENVIAQIKIMRIVKDKNRNKKEGYRDLVMTTAVKLHNYRVTKRRIIYLPQSFQNQNIA